MQVCILLTVAHAKSRHRFNATQIYCTLHSKSYLDILVWWENVMYDVSVVQPTLNPTCIYWCWLENKIASAVFILIHLTNLIVLHSPSDLPYLLPACSTWTVAKTMLATWSKGRLTLDVLQFPSKISHIKILCQFLVQERPNSSDSFTEKRYR